MNLKKIAKKGGFGLVGRLATGNVEGAFPVIAKRLKKPLDFDFFSNHNDGPV